MTITRTRRSSEQRDATTGPAASAPADRRARTQQLVDERVAQWSPETSRAVGDEHDKGELSLCVGEAA